MAEGKDQPIVIVVEHPTYNKSINAFMPIILWSLVGTVNKNTSSASTEEERYPANEFLCKNINNLTASSPLFPPDPILLGSCFSCWSPVGRWLYIATTALTCSCLKWEYTHIPSGRSTCLRRLPLGDRVQAWVQLRQTFPQ